MSPFPPAYWPRSINFPRVSGDEPHMRELGLLTS